MRIFFDVDGGVNVVAYEAFVQKNGVFVVVAFPGHEADEGVLAEGDLTIAGGGAVGDDLSFGDFLAKVDDGSLVDAGSLVGAHELDELIVVGAVFRLDLDANVFNRIRKQSKIRYPSQYAHTAENEDGISAWMFGYTSASDNKFALKNHPGGTVFGIADGHAKIYKINTYGQSFEGMDKMFFVEGVKLTKWTGGPIGE